MRSLSVVRLITLTYTLLGAAAVVLPMVAPSHVMPESGLSILVVLPFAIILFGTIRMPPSRPALILALCVGGLLSMAGLLAAGAILVGGNLFSAGSKGNLLFAVFFTLLNMAYARMSWKAFVEET